MIKSNKTIILSFFAVIVTSFATKAQTSATDFSSWTRAKYATVGSLVGAGSFGVAGYLIAKAVKAEIQVTQGIITTSTFLGGMLGVMAGNNRFKKICEKSSSVCEKIVMLEGGQILLDDTVDDEDKKRWLTENKEKIEQIVYLEEVKEIMLAYKHQR